MQRPWARRGGVDARVGARRRSTRVRGRVRLRSSPDRVTVANPACLAPSEVNARPGLSQPYQTARWLKQTPVGWRAPVFGRESQLALVFVAPTASDADG